VAITSVAITSVAITSVAIASVAIASVAITVVHAWITSSYFYANLPLFYLDIRIYFIYRMTYSAS
jgi:hypothetical protein